MLARLPLERDTDAEPAVNRQPGYSRRDSQSKTARDPLLGALARGLYLGAPSQRGSRDKVFRGPPPE